MKPSTKKATKYTLITLGIALFLFLMLPFLEVPTLSSARERRPFIPQIFTTNPLTRLAKRIARVFNKKAPARSTRHALTAEAQQNMTPAERDVILARADIKNEEVATEEPTNPDEENARFFLQGREEDWVLVRQRVPETAPSTGMHEISVKDNAYDRYVKQERVARYTPTAAPRKTNAVPDSKLARLFNPIKRFFGLGGGTAARSGALEAQESFAAAHRRSSSDGIGRNTSKQARQLPGAKDVNVAFGTINTPGNLDNAVHERSDRFADLMDTDQIIQDAADLVAGSIQDPRASQRARQEQENKYNELARQRLLADLLARGGQETPQDALPETTLGCKIDEGLITPPNDPCRAPSEEDLENLRKTNREHFSNQTNGAALPEQITPVLGVANESSISQIAPTLEENRDYIEDYETQEATKKMYQFMLQGSKCNNDCFWVASNVQTEQNRPMIETIQAAGTNFAGDPLNKFQTLKDGFVQAQVEAYTKEHPQATEEELQQVQQQANKANPPYVVYTWANMQNLFKSSANSSNAATPTVYFADAADARTFIERHGRDVPILYGKTGHRVLSRIVTTTPAEPETSPGSPLSMSGLGGNLLGGAAQGADSSLESRSAELISDFIDNINVRQRIHREIQQDAGRTAVTNTAAPIVEEIQEQAAQELANFAKTSELGKTQK